MKRFLAFYNTCIEDSSSPFLCNHFGENDPIFSLFMPTDDELDQHQLDGYLGYAWGCKVGQRGGYEFNEFRQNVVLLCAAINNEL